MKVTFTIPDEKFEELAALVQDKFSIDIRSKFVGNVAYELNIRTHRDSEDAIWSNTLFIVPTEEEVNAHEAAEYILRKRIRAWLATDAGWEAIVSSSFDFNWGDFMNDFPVNDPAYGIYDSAEYMNGAEIRYSDTMTDDHDALLAADVVKTGVVLFVDSEGKKLDATQCTVSLEGQSNVAYDREDMAEALNACAAAYVRLNENGEVFALDKDSGFDELAENQPSVDARKSAWSKAMTHDRFAYKLDIVTKRTYMRNALWKNTVFFAVTDEEAKSGLSAEQILRKRIADWLTTDAGWTALVDTLFNFTWAGFENSFPYNNPAFGVFDNDAYLSDCEFLTATMIAERDENIAEKVVAKCDIVFVNEDCEALAKTHGSVNFGAQGSVICYTGNLSVDKENTTALVKLENGVVFVKEAGRTKLNENQPPMDERDSAWAKAIL